MDTPLVGAILFGAAGTFGWFRGWVLLGVMTGIRGVSAIIAYRVNPELMRERAGSPLHRDQSRTDRRRRGMVIASAAAVSGGSCNHHAAARQRLPVPAARCTSRVGASQIAPRRLSRITLNRRSHALPIAPPATRPRFTSS